MDVKIEESWKRRLADEFEQAYFKQLTDFVRQEYRQGTVYPPGPYIFNAFQKDLDRGESRDSKYFYGPTQPGTYFVGIKFFN